MSQRLVDEYLAAVCSHIRCTDVHPAIRQELLTHIADAVDARGADAMSEEAVQQAIRDMGDPAETGRQLDRAHRPRTDWLTILATLALVLLGNWAMYAVTASGSWHLGTDFFLGKLLWSTVGIAAGTVAFFLDYRLLRPSAWSMYGLALVMLTAVWAAAPAVNGSVLYIKMTPLLFIPGLAGLFSAWDWNRQWSWARMCGVAAAPTVIYLLSSDMFALMQFAVLFGLLFPRTHSGRRGAALAALPGLAALLMVVIRALNHPYVRERLITWLAPGRDPLGMGYQITQSIRAIKAAGFWGQGATARFDLLPEVHADFIFPYLVFTLGWVVGSVIGIVVLCFLWRLLVVAGAVKDSFGALLVRGIAALLALRFGWNILMTMGLTPLMGVDLPFISHGGALQVLNLAFVGIALSVFRRKDIALPPVPSL